MEDPWLYSDQYTEEGKSKIFNYLEDNLLKDDFINEIDYMSQCIFLNYRLTLEKYKDNIIKILERITK